MFRSRCASIVPIPRHRNKLTAVPSSPSASGSTSTNSNNNNNSTTIDNKNTFELLLLGCGESGKSTLFKQFTRQVDEWDKTATCVKYQVYTTLVLMIMKVYEQIKLSHHHHHSHQSVQQQQQEEEQQQQQEQEQEEQQQQLGDELETIIEGIEHLFNTCDTISDFYDDQVHSNVTRILQSPIFLQAVKQYFHVVHCPDGAQHFLKLGMERLTPSSYEPTFMDLIHLRRDRADIVHKSIEFKSHMVHMTLTSGQRRERKHWMKECKQTCTPIFVVSMSEYDQTCYEDERKNRMIESLDAFEECITYPSLLGRPIFVIMNKQDLFKDKYNHSSLSNCFSDFDSDKHPSPEDGAKFIEDQYRKRFEARRGDVHNLHIYQTSATESYSREVLVRILHKISPDLFSVNDMRKEISPVRRRSGAKIFC